MEAKDYQLAVLNDLSRYLSSLAHYEGQLAPAFSHYWQDKGVLNQAYKNNITAVPHVCVKVPTAGGKTYIAVSALARIFEAFRAFHPIQPRFVVWLVPSLTILEQTVKNLNNPDHPYRQQLNVQFNGRVQIYQKADVLQGAGFDADTVQGQLSIVVMSFDSLKGRSKEVLKAYQDNGYLASFAEGNDNNAALLPDYDKSALINVMRMLNPVLIVDESHNAESDLSVDMLKNMNPSFILDLTATPRNNSNIISYVDALALKKQNMVKLPVIVANQRSQEDVINAALKMRWQLEHFAKLEAEQGGKYIRPIVLFQAEPKHKDDTTTFDKIKATLINLGIDEAEIKIKTASINELKGVDLMAADCPVRYIITINALKEGWDCPFAYILATLANKSSTVDVTQILGRVLRMPHVVKHRYDYLNMSYVFTASHKFSETLQSVVAGLNKAGFSERDCRYQDLAEVMMPPVETTPIQLPLAPSAVSEEEASIDTNALDHNWQQNAQVDLAADPLVLTQGAPDGGMDALAQIKSAALAENARYELATQQAVDNDCPPELEHDMNKQKMLPQWIDATRTLAIPQFFMSVPAGGLFDEHETWQLLNKDALLVDFKLAHQNTEISFDAVDTEVMRVDIEDIGAGDSRATFATLKVREKAKFYELISKQTDAGKLNTLIERLFMLLGKNSFYPIADQEVRAYLNRVLSTMTAAQLQDSIDNDFRYAKQIKAKIKTLADDYAEKVFGQWLAMGRIQCRTSFVLPLSIVPSDTAKSIAKSVYAKEAGMNGLEEPVIQAIANCDNVLWWHRNLERGAGLVLNGFINHYPDFVVMTVNNTLLLVEVKGEDRDNTDSAMKMSLGKEWQAQANQLSRDTGLKYRYMMVFKDNAPEGAYTLGEAVKIVNEL